ncbi:hypothetical protein Rsub_01976 [Raphidocelis subcapitata]|uniref:RRM domain-containing protein n=1 Tax=Raphidocelis subcapitata TaxID=307507 RepID=A0A2V0NP78_9CHLO|nr:hypothetical protein Rsub_01976 [Raphidocelis subcapitata]|eukprot:GBF89404.1 hypothetical protein Rsub_01976 [Raphidocelis subcapitata]
MGQEMLSFALDLDSASALSSASSAPKGAAQQPALAVQDRQPQGSSNSAAQFSGHLMLMDIEGQSSFSPAPPSPSSPGSRAGSAGGRPGSGAGASAAPPPAAPEGEGELQGEPHTDHSPAGKDKTGVTFTPPSNYVDRADRTLFFARVSSVATAEEVAAAFAPCGGVEEVNLFRAWPTAKASKGCGLVVMATSEGAAKAINALNRQVTWDGADGPMVVERCDPARLGVKAANAAACKAVRAAAAAAAASASRRAVAGARPAPSAPLPGLGDAGGGRGLRPPVRHLSQPHAVHLVPAFSFEPSDPAGRGFSAPLLGLPRGAAAAAPPPPPPRAAAVADASGAISGPFPRGVAASGSGFSTDSNGFPAAGADVAEAMHNAFAGLGMQPRGCASGPLHFLPAGTVPAPAGPPSPAVLAAFQADAAEAALWGAAPPPAGGAPLAQDRLAEEMAAIARERHALESASALLLQQQRELEALLQQSQDAAGVAPGSGALLDAAAAPPPPPPPARAVVYHPIPALPPAPPLQPPPQPQQQQLAMPISGGDLAVLRAHAQTIALLSGATLSVDAGAADASAFGQLPPQQQLWLILSGAPPQLQSASTLISRLLGGNGC